MFGMQLQLQAKSPTLEKATLPFPVACSESDACCSASIVGAETHFDRKRTQKDRYHTPLQMRTVHKERKYRAL